MSYNNNPYLISYKPQSSFSVSVKFPLVTIKNVPYPTLKCEIILFISVFF